MTETVAQRAISVIASVLGVSPETISPDSSFDDLGIDSLDALNVVFRLENEFGLKIPTEDVLYISEVRHAVEWIEKAMSNELTNSEVEI